MDIEKGTKVKLTVDLTQYAKGLVAGTEGITAGQQGMWSRGSDRFVTVRFPGITHWMYCGIRWKLLMKKY